MTRDRSLIFNLESLTDGRAIVSWQSWLRIACYFLGKIGLISDKYNFLKNFRYHEVQYKNELVPNFVDINKKFCRNSNMLHRIECVAETYSTVAHRICCRNSNMSLLILERFTHYLKFTRRFQMSLKSLERLEMRSEKYSNFWATNSNR